MSIEIFCNGCGATGSVGQVTAGLRCACGSQDLGAVGLDEPKVALRTAEAYGQHQHPDEDSEFDLGFVHGSGGYPKQGNSEAYNFGHDRGVAYAHQTGRFRVDHENYGKSAAQQHVAYPQGPGTGWGEPQDLTRGWSSYEGPLPGRNPNGVNVNDNMVCPECHGSGMDPVDSTVTCRTCNGTGRYNPPTSQPVVESYDATTSGPPVGGARWQASLHEGGRPSTDPFGSVEDHIRSTTPDWSERQRADVPFNPDDKSTFVPTADTRSPMIHVREQPSYSHGDKPYQMDEASCPNCGHAPTQLRKDKNEDAWWHCPNCGPLANVDKHPDVNPYNPPSDFTPDRSMKTSSLLGRNRKTGKLLAIVATISQTNSGLHPAEVLTLARAAVGRYQEA